MRARIAPALAALALAALASLALASGPRRVRITLRDGSVVEGELVRRTDELYRIQDGARVRELAEDDVLKVEFLEAAPAAVAPVATFDAPPVASLPAGTSGFRETRSARLATVQGGYAWKHASWVTSLAFSRDGKRLLSGSRDGTIVLRDAATGEPLVTCVDRAGVNAVALSADERHALSGNVVGEVSLWDLATGRRVRVVGTHENVPVLSVALSPDGKLALSCGAETTAMGKLWDTAKGTLVQTIELGAPGTDASSREDRDHDDEESRPLPRRACALSSDGKRAVVGSPERVEVWDVENLEFVGSLSDGFHLAGADALAYVPGTHRVLTASSTVREWYDERAGGYGDPFETGKQDGHGRSIAISVDGAFAAWDQVSGNPAVTVRDLTHGATVARFRTPLPVLSLALSPDGKRLATGDRSGAIRLWDAASGEQRARLDGHVGPVLSVCEAASGATISMATDGALVWSGLAPRRLPLPEEWKPGFDDRDTSELPPACCALDGTVALLQHETQQIDGKDASFSRILLGPLEGTDPIDTFASGDARSSPQWYDIDAFAIAPGPGRLVFAHEYDRSLEVWAIKTGEHLRTIDLKSETGPSALGLTPDGALAVAGFDSGELRAVRLKTGTITATTLAHAARVTAIACSPDKARVASGALDETIRLGDLETGKELDRIDLASSHDHATALAFSKDGRALLVGTGRGVVLRFELK